MTNKLSFAEEHHKFKGRAPLYNLVQAHDQLYSFYGLKAPKELYLTKEVLDVALGGNINKPLELLGFKIVPLQ